MENEMLSPFNPETNSELIPPQTLSMEKVQADDFDYLGYDELYDIYDLEDEIEAVEPKDDLESDDKTLLATEIKS